MAYVNINDINLFYAVYYLGREKVVINTELPVLIVLHGGPGFVDHTLYIPFWSQFSPYIQVVFIDQRGNGRSDHGYPQKWNLVECGKDIYKFIETQKIECAIVAGVSWGGYVAMSYVSQYPHQPRALIFCNTEAKVSPEARREMFVKLGGEKAGNAAWEYDLYPEKEGVHEGFLQECLPHYARKKPYSLADIGKCKTNMPMRIKFMKEENLSFDFRGSLSVVCCPVLLLAGREDAGHPLGGAMETASSIPAPYAQLEILAEAGSPVYNDQPELVFEKILAFIKKVGA